jgi:hypothetical protein
MTNSEKDVGRIKQTEKLSDITYEKTISNRSSHLVSLFVCGHKSNARSISNKNRIKKSCGFLVSIMKTKFRRTFNTCDVIHELGPIPPVPVPIIFALSPH